MTWILDLGMTDISNGSKVWIVSEVSNDNDVDLKYGYDLGFKR